MCIVLLCVRASVSKMRALQMRAPVAFILFWLSRRVDSEFASRCIRYKLQVHSETFAYGHPSQVHSETFAYVCTPHIGVAYSPIRIHRTCIARPLMCARCLRKKVIMVLGLGTEVGYI